MRIFPYSLQARFLIGMTCCLLITGTFFALSLRNHMRELYLSEAHAKASLMVAHTEAIQEYVRNVLRPITSGLVGVDAFIIEAMSSSYVSRRIMGSLNVENKDFSYRRVARNARNPDYEVNEKESHFFQEFLASPEAAMLEEIVTIGGREHLVVARPVYFDASCMRCHGKAEDAPAVLLSMYGSERGFGRHPDELAGLNIISVPMESPTGAISKSVTMFALSFTGGMVILLLLVQGFFNRLVVHNLRRVGHILHLSFSSDEDREILAPLRKQEEIEGMIHSIKVVAKHLSDARRQLSDYAKNLETMVRERTADLEAAAKARSADVQLFMRLLSDLNKAQEKRTLLKTTLRLIAGHFEAARAVYVCGMVGAEDYIAWPATGNALSPEERLNLEHLLVQSKASMEENAWYVPVQTSEQNRGILALYWPAQADPAETGSAENTAGKPPLKTYFPLALALGRQLGIALENFDALDVVLRQNALLDSIVEGVSDPLILVEGDMVPILANTSARKLAVRLSPESASAAPDGPPGITGVKSLLELMNISLHDTGNEVVLPDGSTFAVNVHPLPPFRHSEPRAVVHLREATEEKRLLAQMRQADKLAAVGQLAAGLAHEINNPLGVIRCYAELLNEAPLDEQSKTDLGVILRHVDQAQSVLRDMLNFSRTRKPSPGPCDINQQMRSLLELFRPQAKAAHVDLVLRTCENMPLHNIDGAMLEQIIINLLLNALDAVRRCHPDGGGVISLHTRHDSTSGHVTISVLDNGSGVPETISQQIFEPFFTTKELGAGTGLGLTIAFGLLSEMGGRLDVQSPLFEADLAKGTAFHVTLA